MWDTGEMQQVANCLDRGPWVEEQAPEPTCVRYPRKFRGATNYVLYDWFLRKDIGYGHSRRSRDVRPGTPPCLSARPQSECAPKTDDSTGTSLKGEAAHSPAGQGEGTTLFSRTTSWHFPGFHNRSRFAESIFQQYQAKTPGCKHQIWSAVPGSATDHVEWREVQLYRTGGCREILRGHHSPGTPSRWSRRYRRIKTSPPHLTGSLLNCSGTDWIIRSAKGFLFVFLDSY